MSLVNLASIQWMRANFSKVEANFGEALELFKKRGNQAAVGVLQANLATVFLRRGNLAAAQEMHEKTLTLRQQLFKGDHPHVEISLTQLGLVLPTRGDLIGAEARLKEALAMQERLGLGRHADVADAFAGFGTVLAKKGDWIAAQEKHQRALDIRIEVLKGEDNPDVVDSLDALGVVAIAQGNLSEAQKILLRALEGARKSESSDYPAVIPPLWHLGWVMKQNGDLAGSAECQREAEALSLKHGVYGAWPLLRGMYDLADVLLVQHKFTEVEPLLAEVADYVQKNLSNNFTLQRDSFQRAAVWRGKIREVEQLVNSKPL